MKRRGQSSVVSAAVLESTLPQLAPLFLLLTNLTGRLEKHATPEAVSELAEAVRRLSGAQVTAAPAAAAVVQTLADATGSLLKVAAPNSPVRDKVGDEGDVGDDVSDEGTSRISWVTRGMSGIMRVIRVISWMV